ncbi:MAG: class F sortase [Nocardioidaceae bacterium]
MPHHLTRIGRRGGLTLLALVATIAGLVLVAVALTAQRSAPSPFSVGRIDSAPVTSAPTGGSRSDVASRGTSDQARPDARPPLPASRPVSISIPAIGVRSEVFPIGLNDDGTLAVPQPGPRLDKAAWFESSPTPGQPGPSIIEGHVDTESGPSVFFRLGELRPSDTVIVRRQDGRRVVFTVDAVRNYRKSAFPTQVVYGGNDLHTPQLRLITCSNFDPATRHHIGNAVVFAHLSDSGTPR